MGEMTKNYKYNNWCTILCDIINTEGAGLKMEADASLFEFFLLVV